GHSSAATSEINHALTLDPMSAPLKAELGCNAYYQRRYDDAIRGFRAALDLDPQSAVAYWGLAKALNQQQRFGDALAQLANFPSQGAPVPPIILTEMACAYAGAGRVADARRTIGTLASLPKQTFVDPYLIATIYLALNDKANAFAWLDKAYDIK